MPDHPIPGWMQDGLGIRGTPERLPVNPQPRRQQGTSAPGSSPSAHSYGTEKLSRGGGPAVAESYPFRMTDATSGATLQVVFDPDGAVVTPVSESAVVPTIGGTTIDTVPAPTLATASTGVAYFHADNTVSPVTVEILFGASVPSDTYDAGTGDVEQAYRLIGNVTVAGGVITNLANTVRTAMSVNFSDAAVWWAG